MNNEHSKIHCVSCSSARVYYIGFIPIRAKNPTVSNINAFCKSFLYLSYTDYKYLIIDNEMNYCSYSAFCDHKYELRKWQRELCWAGFASWSPLKTERVMIKSEGARIVARELTDLSVCRLLAQKIIYSTENQRCVFWRASTKLKKELLVL